MASPLLLLLVFLLMSLLIPTVAADVSGNPSLLSSPTPSVGGAPAPSPLGGAPAPSPLGGAPAPSPLRGARAPSPSAILYQLDHLAPILADLGFLQFAVAAHEISGDLSASGGPVTVFAPTDSSVLSCTPPACSPLRLLGEHIVPGRFSRADLADLPFGAKLETSVPDRCLTITSSPAAAGSPSSTPSAAGTPASSPSAAGSPASSPPATGCPASAPSVVGSPASSPSATGSPASALGGGESKIFLDGVEITRPGLYDDGTMVIHGLAGFVSPLSEFSCVAGPEDPALLPPGVDESLLMRLMLRDAILRLHHSGYSILSLAMRVKYQELVELRSMTVFAIDDATIFAGAVSYVESVRFHVVPDRLLVHADLVRLPEGTVLPTLIDGRHLVVTTSGAGLSRLRINFVPIKAADVIYNEKIAVHGIYMPFPPMFLADRAAAPVQGQGGLFDGKGACGGSNDCAGMPSVSPAPSVSVNPIDNDGL